jgi:hypothetical protein
MGLGHDCPHPGCDFWSLTRRGVDTHVGMVHREREDRGRGSWEYKARSNRYHRRYYRTYLSSKRVTDENRAVAPGLIAGLELPDLPDDGLSLDEYLAAYRKEMEGHL